MARIVAPATALPTPYISAGEPYRLILYTVAFRRCNLCKAAVRLGFSTWTRGKLSALYHEKYLYLEEISAKLLQ
eukprot:2718153-Rhodomonas_salina.1